MMEISLLSKKIGYSALNHQNETGVGMGIIDLLRC